MRRRRLQPLVWPTALLAIGAVIGLAGEAAVGRWQAYQIYGIARPVADLTLLIGAIWLVVAVVGVVRGRRG